MGEGIMASRSFIRVSGLALLLLACCCFAQAQDNPKDSVIITVGFIADEYLDLFDTSYRPGITAALNAKIAGDKTRLGGKFRFDKLDEIKAYSFGPELCHKISFVDPYAHFLVGFQTVTGVNEKEIIRTVGACVRLNLGHVVLNPLQIDFTNREKRQLSASVGLRF